MVGRMTAAVVVAAAVAVALWVWPGSVGLVGHGKSEAGSPASSGRARRPIEQLSIGVKRRAEDCGIKTRVYDALAIHYTGWLHATGEEFDSSIPRGDPYIFTLGAGQVVPGWDQGLVGMCIGDVRKLSLPAELGYGASGVAGKVPPNADLIFEIELLNIERRTGP
ncbi:uncharacterized protein MONBRDRAFT_29518 [Monosiga brevicollis MX1]|uniref:peptidylprolyl isomerase n=1 Tax=Monosiga brevicollis TaxID=81824 RepID=A9VBB5_MONBE|nr:uncharacterized protein MONBRDRAFT_29518 [Monosiga brevicollis MX1]EDQ85159.1 predicted protein [Monosiga brevicollis MX1]|eukprot:XP_001749984.1 hypothetical protein [Monosiga brevicollis MX1]